MRIQYINIIQNLMEMETEICEWDFMYVKNALALTHAHTQIASQSHITY